MQEQSPAAYCKTRRLYPCFKAARAVIYDYDCCCLRQIENGVMDDRRVERVCLKLMCYEMAVRRKGVGRELKRR